MLWKRNNKIDFKIPTFFHLFHVHSSHPNGIKVHGYLNPRNVKQNEKNKSQIETFYLQIVTKFYGTYFHVWKY
jgi:hypothetical protein